MITFGFCLQNVRRRIWQAREREIFLLDLTTLSISDIKTTTASMWATAWSSSGMLSHAARLRETTGLSRNRFMGGTVVIIITIIIIIIIFSDLSEGFLYLLDQNIQDWEDEIKELEEDLGLLETKADLTFGRDNVDVEE